MPKAEHYAGATMLFNIGGVKEELRPFLVVKAEGDDEALRLSGILSLDPGDETGWLNDRGYRASLHYFCHYVKGVRIGVEPGQVRHK